MLKTDYSINPSVITADDVKRRYQNIRNQRKNQLASIIDECHRIRSAHKRMFDKEFDIKSRLIKPPAQCQLIKNQTNLIINYRTKFESDSLVISDRTEHPSESSILLADNIVINQRQSTAKTKNEKHYSSVSSVTSNDKQNHKVYEKWPDYTEISQIAGFRIEKIPHVSKTTGPSDENIQTKRIKSKRMSANGKKSKIISANPQDLVQDEPLKVEERIIFIKPNDMPKPKLPTIICPSSKIYSKRAQTREWLMNNIYSNKKFHLV